MHSVESHYPSIGTRPRNLLLAILALAAAVSAAPRKGARTPVERAVARPAPETVYVAAAPMPAPVREIRPTASEDRRREEAFSTGPTRDYVQAFGLFAGFYAAEVLGSNPYANAYWDLYLKGQPVFFEFGAGVGTVQSAFSESVVGGDVFPHNYMLTVECLGGYSYSGLAKGNGRSGGLFPYFVAGITAVYQGGVPNIGGVVGFGNRMALPFGPKRSTWALNYGLRDHIYSQKIRTQPSMTQNFVLLLGVQKYY